jgi:hypothetical protein
LEDTRVVIVNGARQTGKSTLAEVVLRQAPNGLPRFLDRGVTRAAAKEDPEAFVRHDGLLLVDEVQRVPELLLSIKYEVDRDPRPGRFLLTGSARLLGMRQLPDALVGRAETIELWPLSQGEIDAAPDGFVDAAFRQGHELQVTSELRRKDYFARAVRGGYPEAVRRTAPARRRRFFDDYLADLIGRDVRQISDIERAADIRRLLVLLAGRAGGLLRYEHIASDLAVPATTVRRYVEALELIYVVRAVPAWSSSLTTRAISTPKLLFVDSGLGAHLAGSSLERLAGQTDRVIQAGGLIENFVLGELARQLTWAEEPVSLYHYRDRDGNEVDAVLERNSGEVVGIEVKAAETVRADDFRSLRLLQRRLGDRMLAGFVLYAGSESLSFGDRLRCLPIAALWRAEPDGA